MINNIKTKSKNPELSTYSPLTQTLLSNRGITTKQDADIFLNPDYSRDINDPFLIHGMKKAVDRILDAIKKEERIVIYSDYDADGIPGGVVLYDFFRKINYTNFSNYIPHRHTEGYGLNNDAIDTLAKEKARLIITVDCGITDVLQVEHASKLGIDVIITDHHIPQDVLPDAYVILNSKQEIDKYPDDMLCGAGVAWKLVCALLQEGNDRKLFNINNGWEKWLLDMAGLSTVADMVPLLKENRAIAYFGLRVLRKSPRLGLQKLLRKMRMNQQYITEDDIGFMIAPRINAASRMDVPMEAFRMLSTDDEVVADQLSDHLNNINDERKIAVASIIRDAKKELSQRELREVIVIGNPKWRVGVLGIAASNLTEEFGKPVFIWGREGSTEIKGSCRAQSGVHLVELMTSVQKDLFIDVGGHEFAGGFSITNEKIHLLEDELVNAYKNFKKEKSEKVEWIDTELSINDITWKTYGDIEKLAPFGVGNPKPTFMFRKMEIDEVKMFGKEKNHMELTFKNRLGNKTKAIGFFMNTEIFEVPIEKGESINLVASMEKSMFRNFPELRLRIVDIQ